MFKADYTECPSKVLLYHSSASSNNQMVPMETLNALIPN